MSSVGAANSYNNVNYSSEVSYAQNQGAGGPNLAKNDPYTMRDSFPVGNPKSEGQNSLEQMVQQLVGTIVQLVKGLVAKLMGQQQAQGPAGGASPEGVLGNGPKGVITKDPSLDQTATVTDTQSEKTEAKEEKEQTWLDKLGDKILDWKEKLSGLPSKIGEYAEKAQDFFGKVFGKDSKITEAVGKIGKGIADFSKDLGSGIGKWGSKLGDFAGDFLGKLGDGIGNFASKFFG